MQWRAGLNHVLFNYYNERRAGLLALHLGPEYVLDVSEKRDLLIIHAVLASPIGLKGFRRPERPR
jgi:hypothetical protein